MKKYDSVVIGFGKGAKTLAGKLASKGEKVALIEKDNKMYGGTCINVGCIPSKSLVKNSAFAYMHPEWDWDEKSSFYRNAVEKKRKLTAMLREKNFKKLNDFDNVDVINGFASFISNSCVKVTTSRGEEKIEGERFYINTGGTPVLPKIDGIDENPDILFSEQMLDLDVLPKELVIIGGGYIGLEFASMYSGFGSKVTVVQHGEVFIPKEDRDIAENIQQNLESRGVSFIFGASTKKIMREDGKNLVVMNISGSEKIVPADVILIATGRRPNTDGLSADMAGVELTERGAVKVDDKLKTSADNIWAMGDVTGGLQFTYTSLDDFRIVWAGLSGGSYSRSARKAVPYSVFISPAFSRCGMNEDEAIKAGLDIVVKKMLAAAIPKAQVLESPQGLLKAVIDKKTNKILGVMLICEESFEMINTVKLAMDMGTDYHVLADQVFTHPTMSEALNDLFA